MNDLVKCDICQNDHISGFKYNFNQSVIKLIMCFFLFTQQQINSVNHFFITAQINIIIIKTKDRK